MNGCSILEDLPQHPSSGGDWNGTLYVAEDYLYRTVSPGFEPTLQRLQTSSLLNRLVQQGLLIGTEVVPGTSATTLLRHPRIPLVTYPAEWAASMLRDAAVAVVDLELELTPHQLSNHDPHPWNVLFQKNRPVFVDLGGIMPVDDESIWPAQSRHPLWPALSQFEATFLNPLRLMSWGHHRIARALLTDFQGVNEFETKSLRPRDPLSLKQALRDRAVRKAAAWTAPARKLGRKLLPRKTPAAAAANSTPAPQSLPDVAAKLAFLQGLRQELLDLRPAAATSYWSRYYSDFHRGVVPSQHQNDDWTSKNANVTRLLAHFQGGSLIDIGCNTGWYSLAAAQKMHTVIACDTDETCVDNLYHHAREHAPHLHPLVFNARSPTPAVGPGNQWLAPALERLQSDVVLLLAVMHHLVLSASMTFEQITQTVGALGRQGAIIEFIPPEDEWVRSALGARAGMYTYDNFRRCLSRYYREISEFDSFPQPRKLLLCRR